MKNLITILVFAFIPSLSFCQDNKDYVINLQGDTLRGTVKILSMDPVDQVRVVMNKKKTTFTALKARAIFFKNEMYHSIRYRNTQKFMKVIKSGFLSLYSFKLPNQTRYDGRLLSKRSGETMEVPNLGFKKMMAGFLIECESVSEAIKDETLKAKDLNEIIDKFNACTDKPKKANDATIRPLDSSGAQEKLDAVNAFKKKVDALETFSTKKDVLDILGDIQQKLEKQEIIPSYLYGVLKTHLANQPTTTDDLEKLIALLSK